MDQLKNNLKVLREKIKNLCDVELDNAEQDGQFVAHHIITYLKKEVLALLDEHEAELRDKLPKDNRKRPSREPLDIMLKDILGE